MLDVVVADSAGAAILLYNGSAAIFGGPRFYHPSASPLSMAVVAGDFNGDGKADFALSEYGAQRLDVYLGNGDGTFAAPTSYANLVPRGGRSMLARDFNNDGILDIMVRYDDTSYLALYLGNSNGTFRTPLGINTSLTQNGPIAADDFNRDGKLDLVAMRAGVGDEIVMLGNGTGHFTFGTKVFDAWPGGVATGDLNGDSLPDIVTGHALSPGLVSISLNTTPIQFALDISAPATAAAGVPFTITVTAKDGLGATLTSYTGTIHFSSTDPSAILPADATLTNGVGTFTVTLLTAGTRVITATDTAANVSATSGPIVVSGVRETPPVVAKFGLGLYRWTAERGWKVLSTMNAQQFITTTDGQFVVADFGHNGLWRRGAATGWLQLSDANVEHEAVSRDGQTVVADFGEDGLQRWTESGGWETLSTANVQDVQLSSDGELVVADFGKGLKRWRPVTGWSQLSALRAQQFAISSDGLTVVADFGAKGLQRWTESGGWETLSTANVEQLSISIDGRTVVADFGPGGLRRWAAGAGWETLSTLNARQVSISSNGQTILANFGAKGLRRWSSSGGWVTLSDANVQDAILSSDGQTIVADCGVDGLRLYETSWTQLSALNASQIAMG